MFKLILILLILIINTNTKAEEIDTTSNLILIEHYGIGQITGEPSLLICFDSIQIKESIYHPQKIKGGNFEDIKYFTQVIKTDSINYFIFKNLILSLNQEGHFHYPIKPNCLDWYAHRVVVFQNGKIICEYYVCPDDCFVGYSYRLMHRAVISCTDKNLIMECNKFFEIFRTSYK